MHWSDNPIPTGKYRFKITTSPIGSAPKQREGRGSLQIAVREYDGRWRWKARRDVDVIEDRVYDGTWMTFDVPASYGVDRGRIRLDFRRRVGAKHQMKMSIEFWRID